MNKHIFSTYFCKRESLVLSLLGYCSQIQITVLIHYANYVYNTLKERPQ